GAGAGALQAGEGDVRAERAVLRREAEVPHGRLDPALEIGEGIVRGEAGDEHAGRAGRGERGEAVEPEGERRRCYPTEGRFEVGDAFFGGIAEEAERAVEVIRRRPARAVEVLA